jgi:extracellular factor (EF) 3-hydroxypalmitic acid methyl ester biosynthesis protein
MNPRIWQDYVDGVLLTHPVRHLVHQCPFTHHAFAKPRGYPGDAILLDHIYGLAAENGVPHDPMSAGVYGYTTNGPAPRAVRYRRQFIADMVHEVVRSNSAARILAIAAGHLREANLVKPNGSRFEWLALDQDEDSLRTVTKEYAHLGVTAIHQNIRRFITGRSKLGKFDLIYAAGLYDYLADDVAKRLLRAMIDAANPGARVMIANFMPDIADVGYMESYMAWRLLYRSPDDLAALVASLDQTAIENVEISTDPDENIAFAVLKLRSAPKAL